VNAGSGFPLVRAVSCKARRDAGFAPARLDSPSGHRPSAGVTAPGEPSFLLRIKIYYILC